MPEPPSQLPPDSTDRQRTLAEEQSGGSLRGATRWGRRLRDGGASTAPQKVGGPVVVIHGDDPDVLRPLASWVRWVGAATPNNAADYDDWYPADVTA